MRMHDALECYIDNFNKVNVYISKNFYGGLSRIFHLKDSRDNIIPLSIKKKEELSNQYIHYELSVDTPLEIGEEYMLFDEHCQSVPAQYSHIVKTGQFDEEFAYDKDDLGITYTPKKTTFRLWAPTAFEINLILRPEGADGPKEILPMKRMERGLWEVSVNRDLLHVPYTFTVRVNGVINETVDPYNPFLGINGTVSVVDDLSLVKLPEKIKMPEMNGNTDAIIYEASVRDMTSQTGTGITHPRQFLGFVEENKTTKERRTGFSYIKELAPTHVQLLPVFFFGSVDEAYPNIFYNWGYDPMHYRALEGSYSSDPADARTRIEEFSKLVHSLHEAGIRVNLDLVFNHVYNKGRFALEKLVPNYYFLMSENGDFSNGSFCGNDIDTRPKMSRKYFVDTTNQIIDTYDVDGFRFDLMGIIDIDTMNEITKEARKRKKDFMIYGEGWNMPSFVPENLRASQNNQAKMPEVGHFSDRFREVIRGNNNDLSKKGYASGNTDELENARQVMLGSVLEGCFTSPEKAVNYVECHDNHTLWDKNRQACKGESSEIRDKRQILTNAMVLMAQGIPFIHAGQEFGRTKQNLGNTYNRSDSYNRMDYFRRNKHEAIVDATKKLIEIRKNHPALRLLTKEEIENNVSTENMASSVLVYRAHKDDDSLVCFFNPTDRFYDYNLNQNGKILFDSGKSNPEETNSVVIAPYSAIIVELH
ncbi:type I pullulanase [Ileibacterium valens]|uniref:type I pullulanase n=1 Tax=Ileibacterium valens TaxID=1862668 RepID=UPI00272CE665|nr:type I pullulanase [Ileibacterium valens]